MSFEQHQSENWPDPEIRDENEFESRAERLEQLEARVEELFPGDKLAVMRQEIIDTSFHVPQFSIDKKRGKVNWVSHHNEGMFMDSHLDNILKALAALKAGEFPDEVPIEARQMMQDVVSENEETLKKYTFLHDIDKAHTLVLRFVDGSPDQEVSWEEWQAMLPDDAKDNPATMRDFCHQQGLRGLGYQDHGKQGKQKLLDTWAEDIDAPDLMYTAIGNHEIAFQFKKVNLKTYQNKFDELTDDELAWSMTASYIDAMGSFGKDGKPVLKNFIAMADTVHNYKIYAAVNDHLFPKEKLFDGLDRPKVDKAMLKLWKQSTRYVEDSETIVARLKNECAFSRYDVALLKDNLEAVLDNTEVPDVAKQALLEVKNDIFDAIDPDTGLGDPAKMKDLRSKLGAANMYVLPALKKSELR